MTDKDKTPPSIGTGSFVSWSGGKGRVDLIVTSGKVPGVADSNVEATTDSPAARVVVWRDGKPTREKIAASTHTLKRIAPLDKDEAKSDPVAALVALHGRHEEHVADLADMAYAALSGEAVKSAYDRGVMAWPGEDITMLSPTEWGLARAEHLVKAAVGEAERTNDGDLLHPEHPLATKALATDVPPPAPVLGVTDPSGVPPLSSDAAGVALDLTEPTDDDVDVDGGQNGATVNVDEVTALLASIEEATAAPEDADA